MSTPPAPTAAQRKALARARKKAKGLVLAPELWILPEQRPRLDKFIDKLRREAEMLA